MLIALGLTSSSALAQYSLTDQPYIPQDPRIIDTGQLAVLIHAIQTATDPLQALEAYSQALKTAPRNIALHEAYMDRMLQLDQLQMASIAARTLTRLEPENGRAWGVVASVSASGGNMTTALSAIVRAATLAPNEAWIDRLAGQLMAWYDAQAPKPQLTEVDRLLLVGLPKQATSSQAYREGYGQTGDLPAYAPSSDQAAADAQAVPATQPAEIPQDQVDLQRQIYGLQLQTSELSRQVGDLSNQLYSASPDYYVPNGYGYNDMYANYNPAYTPDWWGGWGWGWPIIFFDNDNDGFNRHHHHGDFDHHWSGSGHDNGSGGQNWATNSFGARSRRGSGSGVIASRTLTPSRSMLSVGKPSAGRAAGQLSPNLGSIPLDRLGGRSRGAGASSLVNRSLSAEAAGSAVIARGTATTIVPRVNPRAGVAVGESRSLPFASGQAALSAVAPTPQGAVARSEVTITPRAGAGDSFGSASPSVARVARGLPSGETAWGRTADSPVMILCAVGNAFGRCAGGAIVNGGAGALVCRAASGFRASCGSLL
jgi:hypothetical protein